MDNNDNRQILILFAVMVVMLMGSFAIYIGLSMEQPATQTPTTQVPTNNNTDDDDEDVSVADEEVAPSKSCGEACTSNAECQEKNAASQCIAGLCANPLCPTSTLPGANCACQPVYNRTCGERCGDLPNQPGVFGYCSGGFVCTFVKGPQCGSGTGYESYCVPSDGNGLQAYTRNTCQNGDANSYLQGPTGATTFTQAEVQAAFCRVPVAAPLPQTAFGDDLPTEAVLGLGIGAVVLGLGLFIGSQRHLKNKSTY